MDRTKASQGGFTERDVANSMLLALSGSFQISPDVLSQSNRTASSYSIVAMSPQYNIQSRQDLEKHSH